MSQVKYFIGKLWEIYVKRFHLNNAILSFGIIILAWIMDMVLALYACPLCILTRYVFGIFSFLSLIAAFNDRFKDLQNIFIFGSLFFCRRTTQKMGQRSYFFVWYICTPKVPIFCRLVKPFQRNRFLLKNIEILFGKHPCEREGFD